MNIRELKRRLAPYQGFHKPADDGDDLGGEVIEATATDNGAPSPDEDRGDDFDPTKPPAAPAPAAQAPAPSPATETPPGDDDADDASGKAGKGGEFIPKGRFNEVNDQKKEALRLAELERQRADALERELQALRSAKPAAAPAPAAPVFDESAKEREYADALMEGDMDKALAIRAEINKHVRQAAAAEAREAQRREREAESLQAVSDQAIKDYPYLDTPEGAEVLDLILAARDRKVASGVPIVKALADAVASIAPKFAPASTETPSRELPNTPPRKDTRTEDAIKRGAAASAAQPPLVQAGIGNRATASMVDPANMTDEQFNALSEAEKAKLRGDSF